MDRVWTTPSQLSLLAVLVSQQVQAQPRKALGTRSGGKWGKWGKPGPGGQAADPALLAPAVAQRKPWLVGLGAALACLFLLFVLTVVYAVWCSGFRDRWAPNSRNPPSLSLSPRAPPISNRVPSPLRLL